MLPAQTPFDEPGLPERRLTYDAFRARVRKHRDLKRADKAYVFGVFHQKTGELIGSTDILILFRVDLQTAFIGWHIHNRHWRRGYGREAVEATLDIAFNELKLHRIEAGIEPKNKPSIAMAKALGLRREGVQRKYLWSEEKWVDLVAYAITAEERGIEYGAPQIRADFELDNL